MPSYKVIDADQLDEDLSKIADAIRTQTGKADDPIGNSIAFPEGFKSAPAELVEVGKKAQWDEFWDAYQKKGERVNYHMAFGGEGWTTNNFKPKYDIKPTTMYTAFQNSNIEGDLVQILEDCKVDYDFTKATTFQLSFSNAKFSRLPALGGEATVSYNQAFGWATNLVTIDELHSTEACTNWTNTFTGCGKLENITMTGTLAATVSFSSCPLTAESAKSIINCLKDFTDTGKESSTTLTFSTKTWGYLDAEGKVAPEGMTWREYIQNKKFWKIS